MENSSEQSQTQQQQQQQKVSIEDMNAQQSLEALWSLVNKSASKGVYNIDESYVIKVIFSKLSQEIAKSQPTDVVTESVTED